MRKWSLITAILLLSSAWVVAQSSSKPPSVPDNSQSSQQYPSSGQQPDTAQTSAPPAGADHSAQSIEGCVGGSAGAFTLTAPTGKTYQLAGDTSKVGDHVGHSVQVWGTEEPSTAGAAASAGAPATFTVKKVKVLAASCPNK